MMHQFIHTFKFPLRRWFSRGSSKRMCWLLLRFGADDFWWNGQFLFLFSKDTQLLIVSFYCTILPMLLFPLSFGGIWRTKNLTDANQMWVSSRAIFFQSWHTYESPNSCLLNISSLVIKFREKSGEEKKVANNYFSVWGCHTFKSIKNLTFSPEYWSNQLRSFLDYFSCSSTVRNALQL